MAMAQRNEVVIVIRSPLAYGHHMMHVTGWGYPAFLPTFQAEGELLQVNQAAFLPAPTVVARWAVRLPLYSYPAHLPQAPALPLR